MPHRLRKIRKKRGTRTVGYGTVGQHRGGGQRGGHGKTGRRKHLWSYVLRYEPDYFEKKGFRPPRGPEPNAINVGEVEEQVSRLLDEGQAVKDADGIHIDLKALGYDKLLGGGKVTRPLIVKVDAVSESAAEKIEGAKGKILQPSVPSPPSSVAQKPAVSNMKPEMDLTAVRGIGRKRSEELRAIGIESVQALAECTAGDLAKEAGISKNAASRWIENANELLSAK